VDAGFGEGKATTFSTGMEAPPLLVGMMCIF